MEMKDIEGTPYTLIAYSKALRCKVRLVIWQMPNGKKKLFFSTDTSLSGEEVLLYYRTRFQIEFCFRDAKGYQKEKRAELLHKLLPGMAEDVVILPHFYTDYGYNCVIGAGSYLNHGAYLMDCAKITIGQHCFIGPGCGMYTAIHPILPQERNSGLELCKPITLGDNVWLGGDVTILPGVTIGSNTVIGAGSVVVKDIPSGVVAVGNPCKVVRPITEEDSIYFHKD